MGVENFAFFIPISSLLVLPTVCLVLIHTPKTAPSNINIGIYWKRALPFWPIPTLLFKFWPEAFTTAVY